MRYFLLCSLLDVV